MDLYVTMWEKIIFVYIKIVKLIIFLLDKFLVGKLDWDRLFKDNLIFLSMWKKGS